MQFQRCYLVHKTYDIELVWMFHKVRERSMLTSHSSKIFMWSRQFIRSYHIHRAVWPTYVGLAWKFKNIRQCQYWDPRLCWGEHPWEGKTWCMQFTRSYLIVHNAVFFYLELFGNFKKVRQRSMSNAFKILMWRTSL